MTRKALIIGIDYYVNSPMLHGCVNDATNVREVLERNEDGTLNFEVKFMTSKYPEQAIKRSVLRETIRQLFVGDNEIALLYFSGHGHIEVAGGFLCPSDIQSGDEGISLGEIMTWANESKASNKVIILDSCHSGFAGDRPDRQCAELSDGMTILTASTEEQYASETKGAGIFTTLLVDALKGAAANLVGEITPGSVYAHIDQSLGEWERQRPVFKTNIKRFISLRKVKPALELNDLQRIIDFFPEPGYEYRLDPSYEPERAYLDKVALDCIPPNPTHTEIFAILQKYNRVNLVIPVEAPHMWHAAMENKTCKLTPLGEHYRRLIVNGRI